MRNAIVAAGNSGEPGLLDAVRKFEHDSDPLLKEHAEWAISQLNNGQKMVQIHFFAMLREIAQTESFELELNSELTAEQVLERVIEKYPALENYKSIVSFAVNDAYATGETPVKSGDRLALLPPIAGGSHG